MVFLRVSIFFRCETVATEWTRLANPPHATNLIGFRVMCVCVPLLSQVLLNVHILPSLFHHN